MMNENFMFNFCIFLLPIIFQKNINKLHIILIKILKNQNFLK